MTAKSPTWASSTITTPPPGIMRAAESPKLESPQRPKPPIWPENLPLIRELLTEEQYAELLRRMVRVLPNGPLLDYKRAVGEPSKN